MKNLFILTVLALAFMTGSALAALSLEASAIDSSSNYLQVKVDTADGNPPDSAMRSYRFYVGTANPPTVAYDSIKSGHTFPDTLSISTLTAATKYYWFVVGIDSVTTDTTAVDSLTTADAGGDLYGYAYTLYDGYSTAGIWVDWATPDSGYLPKKIRLYLDKTNGLTAYDSIETTSITDPDTFAVTGLDEGVTYYYTLAFIDSGGTFYYPSDRTALTFTTTDLQQVTTLLYDGYSTAGIEYDSAGVFVAALDSIILQYGKVSGTYTLADTITTVTYPDTSKLTGLDEGVTYYYSSIVYLTDSSAVDTLTEASFTTTDLTYTITELRFEKDSLFLKIDSVGIAVDSVILQIGAGLAAITTNADTITTVTNPDTFVVVGLIEGGTYPYRLLAFLPDSSAIDTGTVGTYTRAHNKFIGLVGDFWASNVRTYFDWDFDSHLDDASTGLLPIDFNWLRVHVAIDGEDDWATSDSINVFIWSHTFGDSTAIDTIVVLEPDTITITPLKYRMNPATDYSDTSLVLHPPFNWGTHYSISADMSNDDGQGDSTTTLGVRSVHVIIEEIE